MADYVHGYTEREAERLEDQANAVRAFLLDDTAYRPGENVLEAGCGVGAQTTTLAGRNPDTAFFPVDISAPSLAKAASAVSVRDLRNVRFGRADLYRLPFLDGVFDHGFVCYVLEHLPDPVGGLAAVRRAVAPGGTVTVIEGDHGSCYWHPSTECSRRAWWCLVEVQGLMRGNALIGRELYPLLTSAGLREVAVSPRMIYVDHSRPDLKDAFVRKTIIAMVEGVREEALERGLIDERSWRQGIEDLNHVADSPEGTFCYTFFKAIGTV